MRRKKVFLRNIFILILILLIGLFPNICLASNQNKTKTITSGKYGGGYRYNIQGWVYIHIEGEPYERGYQYGYLASSEIVDMIYRWSEYGSKNIKIFNMLNIKDQNRFWEFFKSKAMKTFEKHYPDEFKMEIKGIADGVKAQGKKVHGHDVEYEDILALNEFQDCWWYFTYFRKQFHPMRNIFFGVKNLITRDRKSVEEGFCSAFIATGDATDNGDIVIAHSTAPIPYFMQRCNIILDVKPSNGYRFIMTSPPGYIWSNENYYQNEEGIVIIETTLPQGPWKRSGIPIAIRLRNSIQYSDSIDDVIKTLLSENNGLYTCEWLIGDSKTGEIASIELALYNTPIKRTKNGFYWSCNVPHNIKVQKETLGITENLGFLTKLIPFMFDNEIVKKFEEVKEKYYGKIDTNIAKDIMATYPICKTRTDCKITDSKLLEKMGLIAQMGNPNGSIWIPSDDDKKKFEFLTVLPANGWTNIFALKSNPKYLDLNENLDYEEDNGIVLWQYETDDILDVAQPSIIIDDDVYGLTSSGTIYCLDFYNGRLNWDKKICNKSIDFEVSEDFLFITSDKGLFCVFKDSGEIRWEQSINQISSKPVIVNDQIIVSTYDGELYGFDFITGEEEWIDRFDDQIYISKSKGDIICIGSRDRCFSYDVEKKEILWEFYSSTPITALPIIVDDTVYVGSWSGNLFALDFNTGDKKWSYETGWGIDSRPYVKNGVVYIGSLDNNFYALDDKNGAMKWFYKCKSAIHSNPVVYGDFVFFGCDDGRFYALDKTDGSLEWSFTPAYYLKDDDDNYITTPIVTNPVVENGVVCLGVNGIIYMLDAQTIENNINYDYKAKIDLTFILIIVSIITALLIFIYAQIKKEKSKKN